MVNMIYAQIGAIFVVSICLFAFIKGEEPERIGAGAFLFGWFASIIIQQQMGDRALYGVFALDLLMLFVLIGLVWKAKRIWPVWAGALQLLAVMSHILIISNADMSRVALYTVLNLTGYGVLISIGVGTFWAWQDRRAASGYR